MPASVLAGEDALAATAAATSPPGCHAGGTRGGASALAFPRKSSLGKREEGADLPRVPGISSWPCVPRVFFFSCRDPEREQGTACVLDKGSD